MTARNALITGLALVVSFAGSGSAKAACNSIPVASEVSGNAYVPAEIHNAGGGDPLPLPSGFEGAFRYKAAYGRTDGVFYAPGYSQQLRFAADGLCVGDPKPAIPEGAPLITPIGPIGDLAIFVAYDSAPGYPIPVWSYLATPSMPLGALRDAMAGLRPLKGRRPTVHFATLDWDRRVSDVPIAHGVNGVGIDTPSLVDDRAGPANPNARWHLESSGVRILGLRIGGKNPQQLAAELDTFLDGNCKTICARNPPKDLKFCVDRIYSSSIGDAISDALVYEEDKLICEVSVPSDPDVYTDFAKNCEETATPVFVHSSGPQPVTPIAAKAEVNVTAIAGCSSEDSQLKIYRGSCGAIQIPLNYKEIRRIHALSPGLVTRYANRRLSGKSGVGRELDADEKRIFIPGREFIGSTPHHDGGGNRPDTNWRLPDVDVFYPDGQDGAEIGLEGVVDKNDSILHILPRHPTSYVCPAEGTAKERGCMKTEAGASSCACTDTGASSCACKKAYFGGQYFACDGGDRTNMPCTRDAHCESRDKARAGGLCNRQPICRPKDTVWRRKAKNNDPDPAGSVACWGDADCADAEQCGYSLFDFKVRMANTPAGIYLLDRDVVFPLPPPPEDDRIRRGACVHDREVGCSNAGTSTSPAMCPDAHRCRGFMLNAGKVVPPPTP